MGKFAVIYMLCPDQIIGSVSSGGIEGLDRSETDRCETDSKRYA